VRVYVGRAKGRLSYTRGPAGEEKNVVAGGKAGGGGGIMNVAVVWVKERGVKVCALSMCGPASGLGVATNGCTGRKERR
jgi:uncharacterized spore protein YtfJ